MHLEKPLAFLQPERERENAFGHAWELRNLDGEFFLVRKRRVEISSLACSFLSTDNLSRLLVTRVLSFFDRVAANVPSFFFDCRFRLPRIPFSRERTTSTMHAVSSRYSQYGGLAGYRRNGKKTKIGIFRISRIRICSKF